MKNILWYLWVVSSILSVVAIALLYSPLGARPLAALFSVGNPGRIDFTALKLTDKPNQFLMCPPGYCMAAPHADSPLFNHSVDNLYRRWHDLLVDQPRVELLAKYDAGQQFDYLQRSARFRFPDVITVRFIPVSPKQSTLAIYSRSIYGKSDFGVNRKRIDSWLKLLRETQ